MSSWNGDRPILCYFTASTYTASFPRFELVPSGGVTLETVGDFLRAGACAVGVARELVHSRMLAIEGGQGEEYRARKLLKAVPRARGGSQKAETARRFYG